MKVIEISEIQRKDIPLHYREVYTGIAIFQNFEAQEIKKKVEFSIERTATGSTDITVNLLESMDYPRIPVLRSLKDYISQLNKQGKLR
jgi:hypothetical protein